MADLGFICSSAGRLGIVCYGIDRRYNARSKQYRVGSRLMFEFVWLMLDHLSNHCVYQKQVGYIGFQAKGLDYLKHVLGSYDRS